MPDLLDEAIAQATASPSAAELRRESGRFDELRRSPVWNELRAEVKARREAVISYFGAAALKPKTDWTRLRDEAIYSRGFLDGCNLLLDRPHEVGEKLERLISDEHRKLQRQREAALSETSPYA